MGFFDSVKSLMSTNPTFEAGLSLGTIGILGMLARKTSTVVSHVFKKQLMTSMEVPMKDPSYSWVLEWVGHNASRHTQHITAVTKMNPTNDSIKSSFELVPSPGIHFFVYKRSAMFVERTRETKGVNVFETIKLTCLGRRKDLFAQILVDAERLSQSKRQGKTITYLPRSFGWEPFGEPRTKRPLSSVTLSQGVLEEVVSDVETFVQSQAWYNDRGIPYRRGYLLHGPPGTGKTSLITALAGELDYGICVLNLGDPGLTDDRLHHLLSLAPARTLILLEDIDSAQTSRDLEATDPAKYKGLGRLTLSGLLNALDGVVSTDARLIFMTTNHVERLDAAMLRPGRVDKKVFLGAVTMDQTERIFVRFFPNASPAQARTFAEAVHASVKQASLTPSHLQCFFLENRASPEQCIANAHTIAAAFT